MRGPNGFGFTISGQQPCILSCIVSNSPADQAGLRAGDFLISVNGVSVSKITHDAVVNLIGNSVGPIKMTIAENYYSDSSDEDLDLNRMINTRKPKHMHKPRMRVYKHEPKTMLTERSSLDSPNKKIMKIRECSSSQIMHEVPGMYLDPTDDIPAFNSPLMEEEGGPIEYKAIVGYLGTIEMPNQLQPNTRLQTVCSCIRKLRQEKRSPTSVLMTIFPSCLTLKNSSNQILAIYPTNRVVYIGSSADRESRYFGLVTRTVCDNRNNGAFAHCEELRSWDNHNLPEELEISNSCHVFITDPKIVDHELHKKQMETFKFTCTSDVVTGNCLEFPKSALYIVSLIQNMYKLQDSSEKRNKNLLYDDQLVANSPQPSASSNSDSGIGFRDDCGNISDRILVVEFPAQNPLPMISHNTKRPSSIDVSNAESLDKALNGSHFHPENHNNLNKSVNNLGHYCDTISNLNNIRACENLNYNKNVLDKTNLNLHCEDYMLKLNDESHSTSRLTVRAMPNPKKYKDIDNLIGDSQEHCRTADIDTGMIFTERAIDVPNVTPTKKSFESISLHSVTDDNLDFKSSVDNVSMHSSKSMDLGNLNGIFKTPSSKYFYKKKSSKRHLKMVSSCDNLLTDSYDSNVLNNKLSPKVYGVVKPNYSCEELSNIENSSNKCGYSSLQDLHLWTGENPKKNFVAQSEPDVRLGNKNKYFLLDFMVSL